MSNKIGIRMHRKLKDIYDNLPNFQKHFCITSDRDQSLSIFYKKLIMNIYIDNANYMDSTVNIEVISRTISFSNHTLYFRSKPFRYSFDAKSAFLELDRAIRLYESDDIGCVLQKISGVRCE